MLIGLKIADEQKDRVIATVSHELRTPINGIIGLLEMITARVRDDRVSPTYLDHCKSCSKLLLYLVNSILDLSQIRNNCLSLNKEWLDLDQLLEEVKSLYIFQSEQKGISFTINRSQGAPVKIFTDKYRLIQVLINLLGNAMKFTFKGGITLKISSKASNKGKIIFEVEDSGIGIKESDQPKLFKMFGKISQSNKNINSHGVGLGLTIANELVKLLNDQKNNDDSSEEKIEFESKFEKGSKFWFQIDAFSENYAIQDNSAIEFESLLDLQQSEQSVSKVEEKLKKYMSSVVENDTTKKMKLIVDQDTNSCASQKCDSPLLYKAPPKTVLIVDDNPFNLMAASFIIEKLG